jgi:hypothetical protein
MKKQLPKTKRRQRTVQQSLKRHHWSGGKKVDAGKVKRSPEQFPTSPRERTETEQTRPKDFGWING